MARARRGRTDSDLAHGHAKRRASVTAAARRIPLGAGGAAQLRQVAQAQQWQSDAWDVFDEVPEVKHAVWFTGNAMSKLRLYAAVRLSPESDPIPVDDDESGIPPEVAAAAIAEIERLKNANGGHPEILRSLNMNLEVAGLGYLVGYEARDEERDPVSGQLVVPGRAESWEVRSVSEVEMKPAQRPGGEQGVDVKVRDMPGAPQRTLDWERDTITPVWQRHPRWSGMPDCHMRAVITDARALQMLTGQVLAEAMNAMPAQLLVMPNELSFDDTANPTTDLDDGEGDAAGYDDGEGQGDDSNEAGPDALDQALDEHLSEAVEDPSSMKVIRPLLLRGPAEYCKKDLIFTVDLKRAADQNLEAKIKARVDRLARGMNLPVEVVLGHQATTFANAEQVDEDTFEDYLEPRCELIVDALTTAFLRPNMLDAEYDPEVVNRIIVWYDASRLIESADTNANADAAFDRFQISGAAYRRAKGFDDADAPDPLEVLITVGLRRGILTADLTRALIELLGLPIDVDPLPTASPAEQQAAETEARMHRFLQGLEMLEASAGTARADELGALAIETRARTTTTRPAQRGARNVGADLLALDRELRTRLHGASEASMFRALERAGSRLRSRTASFRTLTRTTPNHLVASLIGPGLVAEAGVNVDELLEGAWDELERQFMEWGANAQADALDLVNDVIGFPTAERTALGLRQADDLSTAWRWLRGQLDAEAALRLFDPTPGAPALGEFDPSLRVATGLIREALARAGGAKVATSEGGTGVFVTLVDGGRRPAGGIGTGELLRGAMAEHGATVEAYRWVYGPALRRRPFEPHVDLDGIEFTDFDDPVLASTEGWLPFAFFMPGDHPGCVCDVEPIVVLASDLDDE